MKEYSKKKRVLLACERCKKRKKRCDGNIPTCTSCELSKLECQYVHSNLIGYQRHIQALCDKLDQLQLMVERITNEMLEIRGQLTNPPTTEYAVDEQRDFVDPILNLVKKPSSDEVYIGPSAIISKVQAIRKILTNDQQLDVTKNHLFRVKHINTEEIQEKPPLKETEDLYFHCYLTFTSHRYHFIEKKEAERFYNKAPFERNTWENFIVLICLANGSRIAELSKLTTLASPRYYFNESLKLLSALPVLTPMQQIQICMLLALYLTYSYDFINPFAMNVWELSGIAVRKMIQLGYHKKRTPTLKNCVQIELEKRLFWSVYAFDRLLSISVGRPYSIPDAEIDVKFPLSLEVIDEAARNQIYELQVDQLNNPTFKLPVTTITYLIETCKIREIDGRINVFAYGKQKDDDVFEQEYNSINQALEEWVAQIPTKKDFNNGLRGEVPFEYLVLLYHRAKLFLLLPKITNKGKYSSQENLVLLSQCLAAAGGICKAFKQIHKDALFGYSTFSLHTIFLAGVSLVYCVWALGNPPYITAHNDIRACSNLLYSFSERTTEAETYRVLFENLIENILYNAEFENVPVSVPDQDFTLAQFSDDKHFTFTFDDDFWKRLDYDL